jgi:hypothetical protein
VQKSDCAIQSHSIGEVMAEKQKYTLWESFWIFVVTGAVAVPMTVLITIVVFPLMMLTAWIRWLLWGWFIVPYIHLPIVPYWAMLGIGCFTTTWATTEAPNGYKPTTEEKIINFMSSWLIHAMALVVGYVLHRYIH